MTLKTERWLHSNIWTESANNELLCSRNVRISGVAMQQHQQ